jgi:hypothetical protein
MLLTGPFRVVADPGQGEIGLKCFGKGPERGPEALIESGRA